MKTTFIAAALFAASSAVSAQVSVKEPWIRGTVGQQTATGAFMQLASPADTRLVGAQSPVGAVEIHEMKLENNVMRMRRIDAIDLPAGKTVDLKPGGFHLMLTGLRSPLREGDKVPVTLVFASKSKQRETLEVAVPVRALNTSKEGHGHGRR